MSPRVTSCTVFSLLGRSECYQTITRNTVWKFIANIIIMQLWLSSSTILNPNPAKGHKRQITESERPCYKLKGILIWRTGQHIWPKTSQSWKTRFLSQTFNFLNSKSKEAPIYTTPSLSHFKNKSLTLFASAASILNTLFFSFLAQFLAIETLQIQSTSMCIASCSKQQSGSSKSRWLLQLLLQSLKLMLLENLRYPVWWRCADIVVLFQTRSSS